MKLGRYMTNTKKKAKSFQDVLDYIDSLSANDVDKMIDEQPLGELGKFLLDSGIMDNSTRSSLLAFGDDCLILKENVTSSQFSLPLPTPAVFPQTTITDSPAYVFSSWAHETIRIHSYTSEHVAGGDFINLEKTSEQKILQEQDEKRFAADNDRIKKCQAA